MGRRKEARTMAARDGKGEWRVASRIGQDELTLGRSRTVREGRRGRLVHEELLRV